MLEIRKLKMLEKGNQLKVFFNGPFLNEYGFNTHILLTEGYEKNQKILQERLQKIDIVGEWVLPKIIEREPPNKLSAPPYVLVQYSVSDDDLVSLYKKYNMSHQFYINIDSGEISDKKTKDADAVLTIDSLYIRFTEIGCGSVIQTWSIEALKDLSFNEVRDIGEKISSDIRDISELLKDIAGYIDDVAPKNLILKRNFLKPYITKHTGDEIINDINKNVYVIVNAPRVFILECKTTKEFEKKRKTARNLLISNSVDYCSNSSLSEHMDIYAASGSSVILYDASKTTKSEQQTLFKVLPMINLFNYATETLTTNVFFLNNSISLSQTNKRSSNIFSNTSEAEKETGAVVEYKSQIDYFMARYNNYDNYLASQSLRVWRDIEKLWELADRQKSLRDQLDLTDQIYSRLNDQINSSSDKKIATFFMFFTFLSMLSVIVDTVGFTQEDSLVLPSMVRVTVLISMCILFVAIATVFTRKNSK